MGTSIRASSLAAAAMATAVGASACGSVMGGEAGPETRHDLGCFDADYPHDPTFGTPEEAFANALDTVASEVAAPEDPELYVRNDRAGDWIDYELREHDEQYLVWSIVQDDGRWGMTALGGCWPAP